jgi:pimeloyl-ACP methyl ester carboxylesterase
MRKVAEDVTGLRVPRTAHWIAEENPAALAAAVLDFVKQRGSGPAEPAERVART